MDALSAMLNQYLGLDTPAQHLTALQVSARALLIYLAGLLLLRLGEHRFLGKNTAFDIVLGFIFGSTLSRAINGGAPYFETLAGGAVLLALHWLFASLAFRSERFDVVVNGKAEPLVRDGERRAEGLRGKRINDRLLAEGLRLRGVSGLEQVASVHLERNGEISVIEARPKEARVVEVAVRDGVQTVRVELV